MVCEPTPAFCGTKSALLLLTFVRNDSAKIPVPLTSLVVVIDIGLLSIHKSVVVLVIDIVGFFQMISLIACRGPSHSKLVVGSISFCET